jgi:hypothetical protein
MFLRGSGGAKSRQEKAFLEWVKLRPDETRQNRCRLVPVRRKAAEFLPAIIGVRIKARRIRRLRVMPISST